MLGAAMRGPAALYEAALLQGSAGARGAFSETLEQLTALLHDRVRSAAQGGNDLGARGAARGLALVEYAKRLARNNVNPQLITAQLLTQLSPLVSEPRAAS
jgi:DNA polymerase-3 subunit delta'